MGLIPVLRSRAPPVSFFCFFFNFLTACISQNPSLPCWGRGGRGHAHHSMCGYCNIDGSVEAGPHWVVRSKLHRPGRRLKIILELKFLDEITEFTVCLFVCLLALVFGFALLWNYDGSVWIGGWGGFSAATLTHCIEAIHNEVRNIHSLFDQRHIFMRVNKSINANKQHNCCYFILFFFILWFCCFFCQRWRSRCDRGRSPLLPRRNHPSTSLILCSTLWEQLDTTIICEVLSLGHSLQKNTLARKGKENKIAALYFKDSEEAFSNCFFFFFFFHVAAE